jgi:UDP-hydrolysing UDP-N-acetyl-D-glucosamine 2-epimerase
MRRVAIFSTTRADFGYFMPLIKEIDKCPNLEYLLFVGGTHLAKEHGYTVDEIKENSFKIAGTFDYLFNEDTSFSLAMGAGVSTIELAHIFNNNTIDYVCVLGDRYELIPIIINAILFKKIIVHLGGGSKTEGIIDEQIRHMISKASHLHFVNCKEHATNVKNMGEPEWRIFNVGSTAVDNILNNNKKYSKKEIFRYLKLDVNKRTILMTYHPVTLEFNISPEKQIKNVFDALDCYGFQVVITSPNIEVGRNIISDYILKRISKKRNYCFIDSLGVVKYHSLAPYCEFVIGNSSSGIMEVPYFKIPTVNVGDRQDGRVRHISVIDTGYDTESIKSGINKAISKNFKNRLKSMKYKFGEGNSAKKIVDKIRSVEVNEKLYRKKLVFSKNLSGRVKS